MHYGYYDSPLGKLLLTGDDALESLHFPKGKTRIEVQTSWLHDPARFRQAFDQLDDYFRGERRNFDLSLRILGTDFQKQVWQVLQTIPWGRTLSYGDVARRIGRPKAARAVGMAVGANPLSIIIPCHRVIGRDGSLTGFGGGLEIKKQLLDLERASYRA
mgnify:CR=1 FL=1